MTPNSTKCETCKKNPAVYVSGCCKECAIYLICSVCSTSPLYTDLSKRTKICESCRKQYHVAANKKELHHELHYIPGMPGQIAAAASFYENFITLIKGDYPME